MGQFNSRHVIKHVTLKFKETILDSTPKKIEPEFTFQFKLRKFNFRKCIQHQIILLTHKLQEEKYMPEVQKYKIFKTVGIN